MLVTAPAVMAFAGVPAPKARTLVAEMASASSGAICPAKGKGAGLVMPWCDTGAMQAHLEEISAAVAPDAHAVVILDQAGWHMSGGLDIPANMTLLPLPPRSPELNPQENIWQFIRDNWLSNRIFASYDDTVDHCCHAWNKLTDQPCASCPSDFAIGLMGFDQ